MENPDQVDIPLVENAFNYFATVVAFFFLGIMVWQAVRTYLQDEDTERMWKKIGIGFVLSVCIWRTYDLIQFFLSAWDWMKQGTGIG